MLSPNLINDVHIMVVDPEVEAIEFANHGADIVTFHIEALNDERRVNELIKNLLLPTQEIQALHFHSQYMFLFF